jgi:hypothetical protein
MVRFVIVAWQSLENIVYRFEEAGGPRLIQLALKLQFQPAAPAGGHEGPNLVE